MERVYSINPIDQAADRLAESIKQKLSQGKRILLLLSGGSSEDIAILTATKLKNSDLSNLTISLTDERYGVVGHKEENWQQLLDKGMIFPGAQTYRPLRDLPAKTTATNFSRWLSKQLKQVDYRIAIFGMGTDGHTAGIKPRSLATTSHDCAVYYVGDDFERITITFDTIRQIDEAVIQISGDSKKAELHKLITQNIPLSIQPAQILKTIPKTTIFTDIK